LAPAIIQAPVPSTNPCSSHFEYTSRAQKDEVLLRWIVPFNLRVLHGYAYTSFEGPELKLAVFVNGDSVYEFTVVPGLNKIDIDLPTPAGTCIAVRLVSGTSADLWLSVSGEA